jgi:hypothetical protein
VEVESLFFLAMVSMVEILVPQLTTVELQMPIWQVAVFPVGKMGELPLVDLTEEALEE